MKPLTKYKKQAEEAISAYVLTNDLEQLLNSLISLQNTLKKEIKGKDKSLWFKFFLGDTLATDINDIERTLTRGTSENKETLLDAFSIAICSGELQVYYS